MPHPRFFFFLCLAAFVSNASKPPERCEKRLVKVDPTSGQFIINRSSMEFRAWRLKTDPRYPDSAFAFTILSDDELNEAHAIESRLKTAERLSKVEMAHVVSQVSDLGEIWLPRVMQRDGFFLPNEKFFEIAEAEESLGSWKYVLFIKNEKLYLYMWFAPGAAHDVMGHTFVAEEMIKAVPGLRIVWGDHFTLLMDTDHAGKLTNVTYRESSFNQMAREPQLKPHFITEPERVELNQKWGFIDVMVYSFIKRSLAPRATPETQWDMTR